MAGEVMIVHGATAVAAWVECGLVSCFSGMQSPNKTHGRVDAICLAHTFFTALLNHLPEAGAQKALMHALL